jgi:hypothetical protein
MLEHLSSGARDEALSGDLLEEFCGGKADGWYWRQVLAACAVSWLRSLRVRLQMLAFAMLWSMAAPAWNRVCDQVDTAPVWERVWQMCGPFWWILALCGWTLLHASFLWAGIAVYVLGQKACGHRFQEHNIRRAVWLAPLILLPVYGSAFLVASLYWFSWFAHARLAASSRSGAHSVPGRLAGRVVGSGSAAGAQAWLGSSGRCGKRSRDRGRSSLDRLL